jgi:hypothetical protein
MLYLLFFHCNKDCMNKPQCYVYNHFMWIHKRKDCLQRCFFFWQKSSYSAVVLSQHNDYILHKYLIQIKRNLSYNRTACRVEDLLLSSLRSFSNIFTFVWPCIVTKQTRCTNFTNFSTMKLYVFRRVPLSIIRSLFTVQWAMVHIIQVCRQLSSWTRMELLVLLERCLQTCRTYTISECTVNKLLMMDRGTVRNV